MWFGAWDIADNLAWKISGTSMWIFSDGGATERHVDPFGVLPYGLWFLPAITDECEPKKSIEPILHLPWAAFTWEHGFEVEANQNPHLIGGIVEGSNNCPLCNHISFVHFIYLEIFRLEFSGRFLKFEREIRLNASKILICSQDFPLWKFWGRWDEQLYCCSKELC